jgi:hypothetical protein
MKSPFRNFQQAITHLVNIEWIIILLFDRGIQQISEQGGKMMSAQYPQKVLILDFQRRTILSGCDDNESPGLLGYF